MSTVGLGAPAQDVAPIQHSDSGAGPDSGPLAEPGPPAESGPRVAYIMSRFPKLTETFVLNEILSVERAGARVDLYPLLREPATVLQPGAAELVARANFLPFFSAAILASQAWWLIRRPRAYLGVAWTIVRDGWGSAGFVFGGLAILPKVAHAARRIAADGVTHIHCHFANHPATAGLIAHRLTGIPFSFTAHGSDIHRDRHLLCRKVREAAFVIAVSRSNAEVITNECGPGGEAPTVVRCGIDLDRFRPEAGSLDGADRQERPGRVAGLLVIAIGTLHEVKGQTHLIEACRRLVEMGIDVRCDLIGEGPDRAVLEAQVEAAGLAGRVRLLGALAHDRLAEELRAADVLVAPSVPSSDGRREGLPVVLMEAMASGVAVVASRLSGIPELIEDGATGLLTTPGDPASVAEALARLAADPALRRRLASAGRVRVERDYDQALIARRLIGAFRSGRLATFEEAA